MAEELKKNPKVLKREALPSVDEVQADFVSRLQDYLLIDAKVSVSPPQPFPESLKDMEPIFKPVVSGAWSLELPLWSLDLITFPDYVLVDGLSLAIPPGTSGKSDAGKKPNYFKLTGKYYAKGKNF